MRGQSERRTTTAEGWVDPLETQRPSAEALRLVAIVGLLLTLAGAGFFALLASVRSDPSSPGAHDSLSAASTLTMLAGILALCGLVARSRAVAAVAAGGQAAAAVWIAVSWERVEGFSSGRGDSGSLELAPIIGGIVLVDVLTFVWAARFRAAGRRAQPKPAE